MTAKDIIKKIGDEQGWTPEAQMQLLLRFVDYLETLPDLKAHFKFEAWLRNLAAWENDQDLNVQRNAETTRPPDPNNPYKVGDIVQLTGAFLRSVGWYTDVPKDGKVLSLNGSYVEVLWCNRRKEDTALVLHSNLKPFGKWEPN